MAGAVGDEQALLDFAVSNSPVVFYVADPTGTRPLTFISSNVEALTGHRPEDFARDPWLGRKLIHPEDLPGFDGAVARLLEDGEVVHEYRMRSADGAERWYRDHMRITNERPGRPSLVGCLVDVTTEHEAEQARRESEESFQAIIETYPLPVWLVDLDSGQILYESPAAAALFRVDWPARESRSVHEHYVDPSDRVWFLDRLRDEGQVRDYLVEMRRRDGTRFWSSVTSRLAVFGGREVAISSNVDLTEQRQREAALRRARETLEDAIESLSEGFALFDASDRLVLCNQRFREYSDIAADHLTPGTSWTEFMRAGLERGQYVEARGHEEHWLAETAELRNEGRSAWVFEQFDGRWFQATGRRTRSGGTVSIRTDITQLKALEQAVRRSELLVRKVLETCPVPVRMSRTGDGKILYESPATRQLFAGTGARRAPGGNYANPADHDDFIARLRAQGSIDDYELELVRGDGTRFWGSVSARLIEHEGEEVVVSSILDLTPRRTVEAELARQREALHRSEKLSALGVLLAGVAHELNNPLSVVVGQAQLMQETASDSRIAHRAERIASAADRCARIVRAFLAMARQDPAERAPVVVNDLVVDALDVTGSGLRSHDVEVVLELGEDLPEVMADANQLTQVIVNLILNAQQALEGHAGRRQLTVRTRGDGPAVAVEVTDSGPGMSAEVRARIFDPFFTTKEVGSGTGIGLAVCHRIVEAHGGVLEVDSAPGAGATFTAHLPVEPPGSRHGEEPGEHAGALAILLIDDDPSFLMTLADTLRDHGHRVEVAGSGIEALDLLEQRRFDAILSDLRMPSLDGPGLYRVIEEQRPELLDRLSFITGDALSPSMRDFLQSTGCPHMEKPADPEQILAMIEGRVARGS